MGVWSHASRVGTCVARSVGTHVFGIATVWFRTIAPRLECSWYQPSSTRAGRASPGRRAPSGALVRAVGTIAGESMVPSLAIRGARRQGMATWCPRTSWLKGRGGVERAATRVLRATAVRVGQLGPLRPGLHLHLVTPLWATTGCSVIFGRSGSTTSSDVLVA